MRRAGLAALLTLCGPLLAQVPPEGGSETPPRLGEVTVVATRTAESLLNVPRSVTLASEDELRRRQAPSAARMLDEEPGVWNHRNGATGASPILRGQIGPRVLHLCDGVRINNAGLFGGPNPFLNQVPPGAIERIEVLRGPGSLQYGSDAIGGVVNIITRRIEEYPDEGVLYGGRTTTRYGSVDDLLSNDTYAWVSGAQLSLLAGGGFQDVKDFEGGGDFGKVDDTEYETDGFYAKLGWKPSELHLLELSFQRFDRGDVHRYTTSKSNPSGIPTLLDPEEERDLGKLSYEGRDLASWLRSLDAYAYTQQYDALGRRVTESATRFDRRDTTTDQSIYGAGFQGVTPVRVGREHRVLWGGDYRLEKLGSSVRLRSTSKTTGAVTNSEPPGNTPDGSYQVFDAFLTTEVSLRENLTLSAGVRYEVTNLDSDPRPIDLVSPFTLDDVDLDAWWHSATWSAGAVWWMTDELALAGDVATGFRAPNYSDALRFGVPTHASYAQVPSPDVQPEEAIQYEVGPRYAGERVTATLTGYYLDLDPTIVPLDSGTVMVPGVGVRQARRNRTIGKAFVRGVELGLEVRPLDGLIVFGSLTCAYGQDEFLDAPMRFIPPLNGSVGARYERPGPHRWWVEANVRLVARYTRHAPDDVTDAAFASDPGLGSPNTSTNPPLRGDFDLPGYAIAYLRGGVELFRKGNTAGNLTVSVENLLDKEYRETFSRQIVDPGMNVVTAVEVSF